jgi:methyltransferase
MIPAAVLVVVFGMMLIEAARADRNERVQRLRGGVEPEHDVYKAMRIAYPAAFLAMIAECIFRGVPSAAALIAGAALFAAAKAVKWWAILALGRSWTFRVIVVPGDPLVHSGPYRFIRHPNYVAVMGELVSVALMTGAIVSGPLAAMLFGALILRRIMVEEQTLRQT